MYLCAMNLVVDIGNTQQKACLFEQGKTVHSIKKKSLTDNDFLTLLSHTQKPETPTIISSVSSVPENILKNIPVKPIFFSHKTAMPIKIGYKSPETLGTDRLAAAVAATSIFPEENIEINPISPTMMNLLTFFL